MPRALSKPRRVSPIQRTIMKAMSPNRGIRFADFKTVAGYGWKRTLNSLLNNGYIEWGDMPDAATDINKRLFLTERGRRYRERYIHASLMGDLSLIGNGYAELKQDGVTFNGRNGPYKKDS